MIRGITKQYKTRAACIQYSPNGDSILCLYKKSDLVNPREKQSAFAIWMCLALSLSLTQTRLKFSQWDRLLFREHRLNITAHTQWLVPHVIQVIDQWLSLYYLRHHEAAVSQSDQFSLLFLWMAGIHSTTRCFSTAKRLLKGQKPGESEWPTVALNLRPSLTFIYIFIYIYMHFK